MPDPDPVMRIEAHDALSRHASVEPGGGVFWVNILQIEPARAVVEQPCEQDQAQPVTRPRRPEAEKPTMMLVERGGLA